MKVVVLYIPCGCSDALIKSMQRSDVAAVRRAQGCASCALSNTTNLEDGSSELPDIRAARDQHDCPLCCHSVFGVYLNGTSLDDIAQKVGRVPTDTITL